MDIVGAIVALVIFSLPLLLGGLAVLLAVGWPVVFFATRAGRGGKLFKMYKLRSMRDLVDASGKLLPDERRLGWVGAFLRRTSIDELPQLWNVLKGEMSLVGPRPLLPAYLPRYTPRQRRRLDVKPGITGWAQVRGRNALTWEEKFDHDVWYVENRSIPLDLKILVLTVWKVLQREGVSQPGHATMPEFLGTPAREGEWTASS